METIELNINNISSSDKKFYMSNYGVDVVKSGDKLIISSKDKKNISKVAGYIRKKDFSSNQKEDHSLKSKEGSVSQRLIDNNNRKSSNKKIISPHKTSYFKF